MAAARAEVFRPKTEDTLGLGSALALAAHLLLVAASLAGLRVRLGRAWLLEAALRADQHFTDWTVTDRVSGRTGEFDDYLVKGVHVGLQFGF